MIADDIVRVFNETFEEKYGTRLVGGATEPFYEVKKSAMQHNLIHFRDDYAASALHEVAHWCIAGSRRRGQDDYGYWYIHSRDQTGQRRFEHAEARPQALQWLFSIAAGVPFTLSYDNFNPAATAGSCLAYQVQQRAHKLIADGLPCRASAFLRRLEGISGTQVAVTDLKERPK